MQKITTFLMFDGHAEEAMRFYMSLFQDSRIITLHRYGPGEAGAEGTIKHATFRLQGQELMAIDSSARHAFSFTPAMSLFVRCQTEAEIDVLFKELSNGGEVLMPLDRLDFGAKFGWTADRYGVSWQLSYTAEGS
jgi:predicted 3-demethylubiquinone-9 3-methyltransferase (glyoxalase superfamily)